MANPDLLIYAAHLAFWAAFGIARLLTRGHSTGDASEPQARDAQTAPGARWAVGLHALAFAFLYWGIGSMVVPGGVPDWFPAQRWVGFVVMVAGAIMACWAVASFHSWRIQARVDAGHQLATGGPFRWVRHPIYLALDLLALGSALWVPAIGTWMGFALMVAGSEWRARIEERLLTQAFDAEYTAYMARTSRFVPGIY